MRCFGGTAMRIASIAAVGVAAAALMAASVQAQNKAERIDCAESLLYFTDAYECFATPSQGSGGASVRMFVVSGSEGSSFRFLARLQVAEGGAIYQNYSTAQSAEIIRRLAGAVLKSPTPDAWGAYQGFGSTGYMTFKWNGLQCIGFDHGAGGNKPDGWAMSSGWKMLLQGYFCDGQTIAKPDDRLRAFLCAIRVGPAKEGQSALRGSVVAFKPSGGAATTASPKRQAPVASSAPATAAPASPPGSAGATSGATASPPAPGRGPASIESDLSVLKHLYDKGLITKEEYDQKRREILDRI